MIDTNCICGHSPSEHNSQGICKKCDCKKFSGRNSVTSQPSGGGQLLFITQMINAPEIDLDEINREICGLTAPGVVESFDRQGLLLDTGVVTKMWAAVQKEKEDSGLTKVQTLWDKFHELFEKKDFEPIPDLMDEILATGDDQKFASFLQSICA